MAVGYAPLAVGPPLQIPQQIGQLQYPLVTTCPKDSPTLTVAVSVTVSLTASVVMNGVEYTVEDTGAFARYGVQFDVYYDK